MPKDSDLVKKMTTDTILARIDFFISVLAHTRSKSTVDTYRRSLGVFTLWVDEQGGSIELSQKNLEKYPVYLRTQRKVTSRTIKIYLTALRGFFTFLSKEGLLHHDPLVNLNIKPDTSGEGKARAILTKEEIKSLFEASKGEQIVKLRDRAILCCMLLEGITETEVSNCNYGDLEHTLMGEELRICGSGGPLCIPLDQRTYRSLTAYLTKRNETLRSQDPLFISHGPREVGERLKVRSVRSRMRVLLDRAKVLRTEVSPQSLSHTSIYLQILNGVTREQLRERTRPWRLFHRIEYLKSRGLIDPSY